jgi:D-alanine-D-alanine ligase
VKIALTYDLRDDYLAAGFSEELAAEFDFPDTIDAIEQTLADLGHLPERVGNVHALAARLVAGERWDLVFNTAEGVGGYGREAQVPALLDAYGIAYTFADPLVCCLTLHKAIAKRVMRDAGVRTPDFALVADERDLAAVALPVPLFVKPVAEGSAKGVSARSRVESAAELGPACREIWRRFGQPALVERFLPGREFTVGLLGEGASARAIGTLEVGFRESAEPHAYTFENKERCEALCEYRLARGPLAERLEAVALGAWRAVGGRDAGRVDLRLDADAEPSVMEVNALPGLHPSHSDLPMIATAVGMPYPTLIAAIVDAAACRIEAARAQAGPVLPGLTALPRHAVLSASIAG